MDVSHPKTTAERLALLHPQHCCGSVRITHDVAKLQQRLKQPHDVLGCIAVREINLTGLGTLEKGVRVGTVDDC